ncbi:MAG: MBL fold metallo-hydrolase [Bacteroidetes bacterium]|nr:MBL fold metallo-hydrolase [Bacteroidota bacterium]
MTIKQIRSTDGTGTLSYFIIDDATKRAVLLDPNFKDVDMLAELVDVLGIRLMAIIDTHTHADHISGAQNLKEITGAPVLMHELSKEKYKFVDLGDKFGIGDILRANVNVHIDRYLNDGDILHIGDLSIKVIHTPGHTNDHIALLVDGHLFTGDVLLIGQAGRSDLPSGNTDEQYKTIFSTILNLPESTVIHPGHDYEGHESALLADEKRTNPFLQARTEAEYREFVHEFFPPMADAEGGHVVLQCGAKRIESDHEGYVNIRADELQRMMATDKNLVVLDVREAFELKTFGAIDGVVNIPVGDIIYRKANLDEYKGKSVAVICQTGGRSMEAAHVLTSRGFKNVYNVVGGTLAWMMAGLPVTRPKRKGIFA